MATSVAGNRIFVPAYQRAYSWETPTGDKNDKTKTQTDVFITDLEEYSRSTAKTPYYNTKSTDSMVIESFIKNHTTADSEVLSAISKIIMK